MFTCGEGGLGVPCSSSPVTGSGRSHVQPLSTAQTSTITSGFYQLSHLRWGSFRQIHARYWGTSVG